MYKEVALKKIQISCFSPLDTHIQVKMFYLKTQNTSLQPVIRPRKTPRLLTHTFAYLSFTVMRLCIFSQWHNLFEYKFSPNLILIYEI